MNRFVFVSLLVLAWGYWELSGGAGFTPEEREVAATATVAEPEMVTRGDTTELNAVTAPIATDPVVELAPAEVVTLTEPEVAPVFESLVQDAVAETAPVIADPSATPVADLRVVTGDRVNLRDGPGTGFTAIDQLASGTIAEVVETGGDGWVRIRVQGTSLSGWMSADFLIPLNG